MDIRLVNRLRHLSHIIIAIWFLFVITSLQAQAALPDPEKTYGLDPLLHNGSFYSYFISSDTEGTPYFNGPDFVTGSVLLRGVQYDDLSLKYDVVNQVLVFQYQNPTGGVQRLVLSDAWMESFDLGTTHFELYAFQDTLKHIYQAIGKGDKRVLYAWSKQRTLDNQMGSSHFTFTKLKRKSYLLSAGSIREYRNNKDWATLFGADKQSMIKKYLMQHRINVKNASDEVMGGLITYCNSL